MLRVGLHRQQPPVTSPIIGSPKNVSKAFMNSAILMNTINRNQYIQDLSKHTGLLRKVSVTQSPSLLSLVLFAR